MGAIESFLRREGGPVGFALGKPPFATAEWRLAGLEKMNPKIKPLSVGPVISHRGWVPFTANQVTAPGPLLSTNCISSSAKSPSAVTGVSPKMAHAGVSACVEM